MAYRPAIPAAERAVASGDLRQVKAVLTKQMEHCLAHRLEAVKECGRTHGRAELLVRLSKGQFDPDMSEVVAMTDKLEADLPQMLAEHRDIVSALQELIAASEAEGKPDVANFARKLTLHAQTEEQVAYPTSLLIGRYVKLQLQARASKTRSAA